MYCKNGAFKNAIRASGAPMLGTFFFHSINFFIPVLNTKRIFLSVFVRKLIFPISQKYFSANILILIFCYLKDRFESFLAHLLADVLPLIQNIYRFLFSWDVVGIRLLFVPYFVISISLNQCPKKLVTGIRSAAKFAVAFVGFLILIGNRICRLFKFV